MKRSVRINKHSTTLCALAASVVLFACGERPSTASAKESVEGPQGPAAPKAPAREVPLPASLLETKAEISQAKAQIDLTNAKLQILAGATGDDLEKAYEGFVASLQELHADAAGLVERGDAMRERGAAYFQEWEEQLSKMTTASVKDVATKRKDELADAYAQVLAKMQEARSAYDAYWGNLDGIRAALGEELDEATLTGLAGRVETANEQAETLQERTDDVLETIDDVATIFTRG